jgi:hypothetical protein
MTAVKKLAAFWVLALCNLIVTDISEVTAASIIRVMRSHHPHYFYPTTQYNNPEDSNLHVTCHAHVDHHISNTRLFNCNKMYVSCGYNVGIWVNFLLYRITDIIFKIVLGDSQ